MEQNSKILQVVIEILDKKLRKSKEILSKIDIDEAPLEHRYSLGALHELQWLKKDILERFGI